jgi:hypothetical protein
MNADFTDVFCVLSAQGADFIVVAGHAVMFCVLGFRLLIRDKQAVGRDQDQIGPSQQPRPSQGAQRSLFRLSSARLGAAVTSCLKVSSSCCRRVGSTRPRPRTET